MIINAEPAPTVEPIVEVKPQPVVEPAIAPVKPKPLTLALLSGELVALQKIVDQQTILIKQLSEAPVKQRKPPISNGKVQIKDTLSGRIFSSKNSTYQTLLKEGALKELVDKGYFGDNAYKNNFGCYNLFRAYPGRFIEIKPEETKV